MFRVFNKILFPAPPSKDQQTEQPPPKENMLRAFIRRSSEPINDMKISRMVTKHLFSQVQEHNSNELHLF